MKRDSYVIVEKLRAVDRRRFGKSPLASLTEAEMATVEQVLLAVLGIMPRA